MKNLIADFISRSRLRFAARRDGRGKPWQASNFRVPQAVHDVRGMLGAEERRALYWIGRHYYSGAGAIIDAGAYIGASATCLAAGLADNRRNTPAGPVIRSYDYFKAIDPYVAEHITAEVHPIAVGDEYLSIYRDQTRAFARFVEPIPGDFLASRWSAEPIEVLFIDVAKTQALNAHVIREFFPHLIPGRSLVVHQDFYHGWHPYIHVTMEALNDHFEVLDGHIHGQSRLYLHTLPIPAAKLEEVAAYAFSREQRRSFIDTFASRETGDMRAMADVVKICDRVLDRDFAAAKALYADFIEAYKDVAPKGLWWEQARDIQEYRP